MPDELVSWAHFRGKVLLGPVRKQAFLSSEYKIILSLPVAVFAADFSFRIPLSKRGNWLQIRSLHMEYEKYTKIYLIDLVLKWFPWGLTWPLAIMEQRLLRCLWNISASIHGKAIRTRQWKLSLWFLMTVTRLVTFAYRRDRERVIRPSPKTPAIIFFCLLASCCLGNCWSM